MTPAERFLNMLKRRTSNYEKVKVNLEKERKE
jgi:hypothetical protein